MTWSQEKLLFSTDFKDLSIQHTRAEIILTDTRYGKIWKERPTAPTPQKHSCLFKLGYGLTFGPGDGTVEHW